MDDLAKALAVRSLRTIRTELVFLTETSILTPTQAAAIHALLPSSPTDSLPNLSQLSLSEANSHNNSTPSEKQPSSYYQPQPTAAAFPPPAYAQHQPQTLALATALYAYTPSDVGDLAFSPHDRVAVTEFMNADWAKGRNERTGQEGIFPRSYVSIVESNDVKGQGPPSTGGYGNMPLAVVQGGASGVTTGNSKIDANGKKFGKKLGNAAIFGAGATIGSSIVGSIL